MPQSASQEFDLCFPVVVLPGEKVSGHPTEDHLDDQAGDGKTFFYF
jgi:hypothetical protein